MCIIQGRLTKHKPPLNTKENKLLTTNQPVKAYFCLLFIIKKVHNVFLEEK